MHFDFLRPKKMLDLNKFRVVQDFPKKGVKFYDITTVMNDTEMFHEVFEELLKAAKLEKPDVIVALETRGYFFGPALALALNIPFVPIRKAGKLPFKTYKESYELEYGTASIEIHIDAMKEGQRVLIFDDILATGGTAKAATILCRNFSPSYIGNLFIMEIEALKGRERLTADSVTALLKA